MTDLTVNELNRLKRQAEYDLNTEITKIVNQLAKDTGLPVSRLSVNLIDTTRVGDLEPEYIADVSLNIEVFNN